mmetsp:Transcript_24346/g.47342  ORF Transcript_24346/g.47342 Transcript_24346/m.47342 type:complete len:226 (-) Transcript_24346:171-848(-)
MLKSVSLEEATELRGRLPLRKRRCFADLFCPTVRGPSGRRANARLCWIDGQCDVRSSLFGRPRRFGVLCARAGGVVAVVSGFLRVRAPSRSIDRTSSSKGVCSSAVTFKGSKLNEARNPQNGTSSSPWSSVYPVDESPSTRLTLYMPGPERGTSTCLLRTVRGSTSSPSSPSSRGASVRNETERLLRSGFALLLFPVRPMCLSKRPLKRSSSFAEQAVVLKSAPA